MIDCFSDSKSADYCFHFLSSVSYWIFILGCFLRKCVDCSKVCSSLQSYHYHIRYDCGTSIANYSCPISNCPYTTKRRFDLKRHQRTVHKGVDFKPFIS